EVSVPAAKASALWNAMSEAGRALDAVLMGSEALLLLRAEKGFIIAGKDTDGTSMPHDLGLTGPRDKRQGEYVGKRSLFTDNAMRDDRRRFVGLAVVDSGPMLPTGAHVLDETAVGRRSAGYVTSSDESPAVGGPIALGLVERGMSRIGEEVSLFHLGKTRRAVIAQPCFFDHDGSRIDA